MKIVVTGTDTGIGKTIFAAALAGALGGHYWKPIQSGLEEASDSATVAALSGLAPERILAEAYRLSAPRSPHLAAELDGVAIDPERLTPPDLDPLVVEGAGGLLVPVTRDLLYADLFARWGHPVVLVARTGLGTINHSLLSIEALRARRIPILGVAFVGEANEDNEAIIATLGGVKRLGRLPLLDRLDPRALAAAFAAHFDLADFR
ncbi:dethiobiotin synthase [Sphingosinicella sp. LY1275]|uniref:dethiobiotin synthase n=1 Tax=Sphingosinicella sp. LY1275 TaxID=3095379 RepID=UPI002ADEB82F|nr:dethiobiotin synthase [Sphingosinicella sp. LY1275]MEA1014867.1 dethiobiotin synthase [Sphingosinicella sp. LY1275]